MDELKQVLNHCTLHPQKKTFIHHRKQLQRSRHLLLVHMCAFVCVCAHDFKSMCFTRTWQLKNLMRLLLHTSSFSLYSAGDPAHWYAVRPNRAELPDKQTRRQTLSRPAAAFRCPEENRQDCKVSTQAHVDAAGRWWGVGGISTCSRTGNTLFLFAENSNNLLIILMI